jgi:hypothetical protein
VLALPLLWACFDTAAQHLVAAKVQRRIIQGYNTNVRGENNEDYNDPVNKVLLHIYGIENVVHIDELVGDGDDAANEDGTPLQAAQAIHAQRDQMQSILLQLHHLKHQQGELLHQIEASFGSLCLHFQRQLDAINRNNVQRLQVQPPVVRRAGATAAGAANLQDPPAAVVQQQEEGRAELCPRPKSLHELWTEYMFGIVGGQKAAKDFTPVERGRCSTNIVVVSLYGTVLSAMSIVDTPLMLQLKGYTKFTVITC